jgi:hypothetical protein
MFFTFTGAALVIASFSNVITGKDLETAVHMGRFVELWGALAVSCAAFYFVSEKGTDRNGSIALVVSGALMLLLLGNLVSVQNRSDEYLRGESYQEVLTWLNENTPPGSVVLADDKLSYYIPVATRDFVLFQPDGGLYLVPDREVEDRYLASRIFSNLTKDQLKADFRLYAGVGNAVHHFKVHNREVALCRALHLPHCGDIIPDAVTDRGEAYFDELYMRYQLMSAAKTSTLKDYGVEYIVSATPLMDLSQFTLVKVSGFYIYLLTQPT